MKKRLLFCLLTAIALQAEETAPQPEPSVNSAELVAQLKQAHTDLKTLKAEMIAILTVMLEELQIVDTTRNIDFNAWNNLQEYEKYQENTEDAETTEGEQE